MNQNKKLLRKLVLLFVAFVTVPALILLASCADPALTLKATDLMEGIHSQSVEGKDADEAFVGNYASFSADLLQSTKAHEENTFLSPLSIMLALSMTANGADGNTLEQMEQVLGSGIGADEMNAYLYDYVDSLPSHAKSKLNIANSIWFRDDQDRLQVKESFLQTNADYYQASAYASPFDDDTVTDINNWVTDKTDGLIDKIVDEIQDDTVMFLINAMVFDAEWETIYREEQLREGTFYSWNGAEQDATFMASEENLYLENDYATGFIKPYAQGDYGFFAFLPAEGTDLEDLIQAMDGELMLDTLENPRSILVQALMPKFSFDYKWKMDDALKSLGMTDAFDDRIADLSRLGSSSRGNLYIGEVLHKTFIQVDEKGTKAGAVTKVEVKDESAQESMFVTLDRPFVFGIMDLETNLPIFIGTLSEME